jgi:hypothetical protein
MAPRVAGTKRRGDAAVSAPMPEGPASSQPSAPEEPPQAPQANVAELVAMISPQEHEFRKELKELREHLTRNADYVGQRFPEEARKMHYGEIERRSVYGEATPDQAKELHEEGVEFHPLPVRVELTSGLRALGLGQCITCASSILATGAQGRGGCLCSALKLVAHRRTAALRGGRAAIVECQLINHVYLVYFVYY